MGMALRAAVRAVLREVGAAMGLRAPASWAQSKTLQAAAGAVLKPGLKPVRRCGLETTRRCGLELVRRCGIESV